MTVTVTCTTSTSTRLGVAERLGAHASARCGRRRERRDDAHLMRGDRRRRRPIRIRTAASASAHTWRPSTKKMTPVDAPAGGSTRGAQQRRTADVGVFGRREDLERRASAGACAQSDMVTPTHAASTQTTSGTGDRVMAAAAFGAASGTSGPVRGGGGDVVFDRARASLRARRAPASASRRRRSAGPRR